MRPLLPRLSPPAISGLDLPDLGPDRSHLPGKHLLVRSFTWWQRLHFLNPRPRSLPHHVPLPQTPSSRQSPCLWCDVCLIQSLAADPYRLLGTGQQQLPVPTQWHLRHLASSWQERPSLRIPGLADDDPKRLEILNRLVRANQARDAHPDHPNNDAYDGAARDQDLAELLTSRNAQLSKFITHITMLGPYTLTNNLSQISTSFIWIDTYLQQYYNIRKQGAHFFSISSIRFNAGDSYQNFYMELHGALEDSLRPRGAVLLYKNDEVLEADE